MNYNQGFETFDMAMQGQGAFLVVKNKDGIINTMTIGWGSIGHIWSKPILTILCRYSRYSFELLKNAETFTICIPRADELKKELAFCGSHSGRDYDKLKECNLTLADGYGGKDYPIIKECGLIYECKIVYSQAMDPHLIRDEAIKNKYKDNDYHVLYYGEIQQCYEQ